MRYEVLKGLLKGGVGIEGMPEGVLGGDGRAEWAGGTGNLPEAASFLTIHIHQGDPGLRSEPSLVRIPFQRLAKAVDHTGSVRRRRRCSTNIESIHRSWSNSFRRMHLYGKLDSTAAMALPQGGSDAREER
jgi:hypothetical protein